MECDWRPPTMPSNAWSMRQAGLIDDNAAEPTAPATTAGTAATQTEHTTVESEDSQDSQPECPRCKLCGFPEKLQTKRATYRKGIFLIEWCPRCSFLGESKGLFNHKKFWGVMKNKHANKQRQAHRPAPPPHHHPSTPASTMRTPVSCALRAASVVPKTGSPMPSAWNVIPSTSPRKPPVHHPHTHTPTHKHTNTQTHKHKHTHTQTLRHTPHTCTNHHNPHTHTQHTMFLSRALCGSF